MGINYCFKKEKEFKIDVYFDVILLFRNIWYRFFVYIVVRVRLYRYFCMCMYVYVDI